MGAGCCAGAMLSKPVCKAIATTWAVNALAPGDKQTKELSQSMSEKELRGLKWRGQVPSKKDPELLSEALGQFKAERLWD